MTSLVLLLGALLSTVGFGCAFALAVRTKNLSTGAIVLGASSILCGIGVIPFLAVGWKAVQRATFFAVANGAEPHEAGKLMSQYRLAVAATIAGVVLVLVAARVPGADGPRHPSYELRDE